ncbi:MAG: hypothetical protein GY940_27255 [bacterium]|nr:hypothetical protein [bacterium]
MTKKILSVNLIILFIFLTASYVFPQETIRVLKISEPSDKAKNKLLFNFPHLKKIVEEFNLGKDTADIELTDLSGMVLAELGRNKKGTVKWKGKVKGDQLLVKIKKDKFDEVVSRVREENVIKPGFMIQASDSRKEMSRSQEYGKRTNYMESKTILGTCEITFVTTPDIAVTLKQPINVPPGKELRNDVTITVENKGTVTAENFTVELVLSRDTKFPDQPATYSANFKEDTLLEGGKETVASLKPGEKITVNMKGSLKVPEDTTPGRYYLAAIADPEKKINEISKVNNKDVRFFLVSLPAPARMTLDIPDAYLVYKPAAFNAAVFSKGVPISATKEWRKCMIRPYVHQVKHWAWEGFFWEVDTLDKAVWRITGAKFCKKGGSAKEVKVKVEVTGGSKVAPPSQFIIRLPDTKLEYEPVAQKFRIITASYQIATASLWKCIKLQNHIYQMQHELWTDFFWEVDTFRNKVTKITGGKLGKQGGGTPTSLDITLKVN